MTEPLSLAAIFTKQLTDYEPGSREHRVRKQAIAADSAVRERRAMVLRHRDLAARLCLPPLSYARPEQWNGYIPVDGPSPKGPETRAALLDIEAEAWERGQAS
jgi:hypothetical protein